MITTKRILAGICFSEHSRLVMEHAAALARCFDAEVLAVHVLNVRDVQDVTTIEAMGYDVRPDEYMKDVRRERLEQLQRMAEETGLSPEKVRTLVKVGHPVEELLKVIREEKADLVVVGAKRAADLPHILIGSVAEKVFRHSPVGVVGVRHGHGR